MADVNDEIEAGFKLFSAKWKKQLDDISSKLDAHEKRYFESYSRLVSLNAWREHLLVQIVDEGSLLFFLEAQNDALVSHVLARLGAWRSALKSLRSCIENVLYCAYYKDHPVELRQWEAGGHRLGFTELLAYIKAHPDVHAIPENITGTDVLKAEYSTLSRAVHGSAKSFRMTAGTDSTVLWTSGIANLGGWQTRERATITSLNLLLTCLFREHLQGASQTALRDAISLAVPDTYHPLIKKHLQIKLQSPA